MNKKKAKYWRRIPSLDELAQARPRPKKRKITLKLDASVIDFFKREAAKRKTTYKRMIRNLLLIWVRENARQV